MLFDRKELPPPEYVVWEEATRQTTLKIAEAYARQFRFLDKDDFVAGAVFQVYRKVAARKLKHPGSLRTVVWNFAIQEQRRQKRRGVGAEPPIEAFEETPAVAASVNVEAKAELALLTRQAPTLVLVMAGLDWGLDLCDVARAFQVTTGELTAWVESERQRISQG